MRTLAIAGSIAAPTLASADILDYTFSGTFDSPEPTPFSFQFFVDTDQSRLISNDPPEIGAYEAAFTRVRYDVGDVSEDLVFNTPVFGGMSITNEAQNQDYFDFFAAFLPLDQAFLDSGIIILQTFSPGSDLLTSTDVPREVDLAPADRAEVVFRLNGTKFRGDITAARVRVVPAPGPAAVLLASLGLATRRR